MVEFAYVAYVAYVLRVYDICGFQDYKCHEKHSQLSLTPRRFLPCNLQISLYPKICMLNCTRSDVVVYNHFHCIPS